MARSAVLGLQGRKARLADHFLEAFYRDLRGLVGHLHMFLSHLGSYLLDPRDGL